MSERVAYLRVCDFADAVVELQAVATDVMQNGTIDYHRGFCFVWHKFLSVFADDAKTGAVQIAMEQFVAITATMNDDAFPTTGGVVVKEVVEHVVQSVSS